MQQFIERSEALELIEEVNAYFETYGLNEVFELFWNSKVVKDIIHEVFTVHLSKVNGLVENLPTAVQEKCQILLEQENEQEENLIGCTRDSLRCSISSAIQVLEEFSDDDEAIADVFLSSFRYGTNGKMLEQVESIAKAITDKMLMTFNRKACISEEIPDELASLISAIGGGKPMMSFSELLKMMEEDDEESSDEGEEESNN